MSWHRSFDAGLFDIDFNLDLIRHEVVSAFSAVLSGLLVKHAIGGVRTITRLFVFILCLVGALEKRVC